MPLLADPPVDQGKVSACAVLGRALYIACSFEDDCRSLAFVLKIRDPQMQELSDDESFAALSKAVLGRLVDLNKLIACRAKLPEDYAAMLHAARDARNYIAHEAAGELERLTKEPDGLSRWRNLMASKLENVAYGKIVVAVLLSRNSAEAKPARETINAYSQKINSWVFESDARLWSQPNLAH